MECNYSNICFNRFEALRRILKNLTQKKEDCDELDIHVVGGSAHK